MFGGFLSGTDYLPCFGGPADGRSAFIGRQELEVELAVTIPTLDEVRMRTSGRTLTVIARYRRAKQPRFYRAELWWVPPR